MAKNKEVKPLPIAVAVLIILIGIALMVTFSVYVFSPAEEVSHVDKVEGQSFAEESKDEPAPIVGEEKEFFEDAEVGDYVKFGHYDQDGNADDGAEPIEWQVLAKEDGRILVISRYCLDAAVYNTERTEVAWQDCSLRGWLNGDFASKAFSEEEQEVILESAVTENVLDKLFILSADEAEEYLNYASWRVAIPTDTARANGARVQKKACWWWLRNNGEFAASVAYVGFDGEIGSGFSVDYDKVAVRPVMWVKAATEDVSPNESYDGSSSDESADESFDGSSSELVSDASDVTSAISE